MTTAPGDRVCIAIPDAAGGFGQSCATETEIATRGLPVARVSTNHGGSMAAVLPSTATAPELHQADGTTTP